MPTDLAKKLGRGGIIEILSVMWLGYEDLKKYAKINAKMRENEITEEWYIRLSHRWNAENRAARIRIKLFPVTQHEDDTMALPKGSPPTIDFCFRGWDKREGYFGAECKNLYNHDTPYIKRYIETGVKNYYISGRYGSCSTASAMIGYVLSGKATEIVEELKTEIRSTFPRLNLSKNISTKDAQYKSKHIRTSDGEVITLYHLLFDFAA